MSLANQPSICVSIVHYRAPELLEQCLQSFRNYPPALPLRIVVADNSAGEQPIRERLDRYPEVELIEMPDNLGFSAGNNRAVAGAEEDYLFFLNPDTEIRPETIEKLVAVLVEDRSAGAVGPLNLGPEGEIQFSCRSFPGYRTMLAHRYSFLTRWFPRNPISSEYLQSDWDHSHRREVDWVSGAALMVRRADFERIGGFDEAFFLYAEDVDLCYRLHQQGLRMIFEPAAEVRHCVGGSSRKNRYRALWERHRSMYTFYRKHYSLDIPLIDLTTLLGITLRGLWFLGLEAFGRAPHR